MFHPTQLRKWQGAILLRAEQETVEAVIGDSYEVIEPLGLGAETLVYKVKERKTGAFYVAKSLNPMGVWCDPKTARFRSGHLHDMAMTLQRVSGHNNIIQYHEFREKKIDGELIEVLIREYKEGRSLDYFIREKVTIPESPLERNITNPMLGALMHLRDRGEVHRDPKPVNILYDEKEQTSTLIDLGLTKKAEEEVRKEGAVVGSMKYISPEKIETGSTLSSDIFALGITMIEVALQARIPGKRPHLKGLRELIGTLDLTPGYRSRLRLMIHRNPDRRLLAI